MDQPSIGRRQLGRTLLAGTVFAGLGVTTVSADDDPSLSHASRFRRRISTDRTAQVIVIDSDDAYLDAAEDRVLRITDPEERSVRVSPVPDERIELPDDGNVDLLLYDGDGSIEEDPSIDTPDEEIDVDVTGTTSMFETNPPFTAYTVELVAGDDPVASTDSFVYGIGHPSDAFSQDGTTGEIEVTYERPDLIDDSWTLVFSLTDYDADGLVVQTVRSRFEYVDDTFVVTVDVDELDPPPEDGFRDPDVVFYDREIDPDGPSLPSNPNLWASTDLTIEHDDDDEADDGDDPSVDDYANEEGVVDIGGVLEAIDDYTDGEIGITVVLEVIDAYSGGQ